MSKEAKNTREYCYRCHRYSPFHFHVPDHIWEKVVPERWRNDILCLDCFARMGDERLVEWSEDITVHPVSLAKNRGLKDHVTPTTF